MNKANHVPYTWEQIEDQVREAILCQLSILEAFGPNGDEVAKLYLGIDPDLIHDTETGQTQAEHDQVLRSIPLVRHHLHYLALNAYNYAYQLEGWERAGAEDHYEVVCGVLTGFPQTDMHGNPSPLSSADDAPLRRVFETFVARWELYGEDDFGNGLSVRDLALLSNMTVPAVRTSLSKEGFKLDVPAARSDGGRRDDDKSATLNKVDALLWLSRRRGFVPNGALATEEPEAVVAKLFSAADSSFDHALRQSMIALRLDASAVADEIAAPKSWIEALSKGKQATIDVTAIRALARKLKVSEADFTARAVRHLVDLDVRGTGEGGP